MQWQNASYSIFFCFPSGLMDIDTLPYTPQTRASARRSAGRRLLHFQMMMSALKVCNGWRRLFGTQWGRISQKKQVYSPQLPVNATCLTQQRDIHASVLSFPNRNTERWEQRWTACCYANSSQFTNGSSLNTRHTSVASWWRLKQTFIRPVGIRNAPKRGLRIDRRR